MLEIPAAIVDLKANSMVLSQAEAVVVPMSCTEVVTAAGMYS